MPRADRQLGAVHDDEGRVVVTVQWPGSAGGGSRRDRRDRIRVQLQEALADRPEVAVDWDTVSVSAQTVEAAVPAASYEPTARALERRGLRVDRVVERQVVT